ncbi:MAG TPA: hypothetical protein VG867_10535 [Rhizomicrobium sp.]|nr:hypothetical protein [Rhizomicrobium sp.]
MSQIGTCTKIGNRVFFELYVRLSSLDGALAGNVAIGGLPFASGNVSSNHVACSIYAAGCGMPTGCTQMSARIAPNCNYLEIFCFGASASARLTQANLTAATQFIVAGSYHV